MTRPKHTNIIRLPEVKKRTGLTKPSIYRKMGDGTFPKCRKLGDRAVGWFEHELDEWIANLKVSSSTQSSSRHS